MSYLASGATPNSNANRVDSTLHALVATPAVGGVVLLFVVVGMMALAAGMLSAVAVRRGAGTRGGARSVRMRPQATTRRVDRRHRPLAAGRFRDL